MDIKLKNLLEQYGVPRASGSEHKPILSLSLIYNPIFKKSSEHFEPCREESDM